MKDKIQGSIVAGNASTITNATNSSEINLKTLKAKHTIIGFFIGVISELVAISIYEHFFK